MFVYQVFVVANVCITEDSALSFIAPTTTQKGNSYSLSKQTLSLAAGSLPVQSAKSLLLFDYLHRQFLKCS